MVLVNDERASCILFVVSIGGFLPWKDYFEIVDNFDQFIIFGGVVLVAMKRLVRPRCTVVFSCNH